MSKESLSEMKSSRTLMLMKNTAAGIFSQAVILILNFATRTVFINYLNAEYLGINGLFSNILIVLSLAELGMGPAITYSLYRPLSEKNESAVSALMNFYSSAYKVIGLVVGVLGISIIPFLDIIISDTPNIENIYYIYLLFLLNSVFSYFFAYKRTLIIADQKNYIISYYHLFISVLKFVLQILTLVMTQNYILFLFIQIGTTLLENIFISIKTDKLYPFIKENKRLKLLKKDKDSIITNVKALMIYKLGGTALEGTDNIIISAFVGIVAVGKLSNYMLILTSLSMVYQHFKSSVTSSIGNYIAKENKENHEELLYTITFVYFLIYGFSFVCLVTLLNPFIELWIGPDYLLSQSSVLILALNWYIVGMMEAVWTFRSTMGLFVYGKYRPIVSAIINLVLSIGLAINLGLIGVLLGTTITRLLTNVLYDPHVIYKYGFKKPVISYYYKWIKYLFIAIVTTILLLILFSYLPENSLSIFVIQISICIAVVPLIFYISFRNTREFSYVKNILKAVLKDRK